MRTQEKQFTGSVSHGRLHRRSRNFNLEDFQQQDKLPLHTSVPTDVMQMEFSLSDFEQQQFLAAIKSGIYQELCQSGLLTEDQADRLIIRTRLPLLGEGQDSVG